MKKLEDLKVGDKVIVGGAYIYDRISQVEKVTKKHIIVEGSKYSKAFGLVVGCSSYSSNHIRPATEEDIKRVDEETEKRNIVKYLTKTHFEKLSYETLVAIRDMVEKEIGDSSEEQIMKEIEMWLARHRYGSLVLFVGSEAPIKPKIGDFWAISPSKTNGIILPDKLFPEVQWSDKEPTKVKLVIDK